MKNEKIRIGFIGAGAIGSLFGGYLASIMQDKTKYDVIFFGRSDHVNVINSKGLKIQKPKTPVTIKWIHAYDNYPSYKKDFPSNDAFNYLFISTKAYNTLQAVRDYKELIKSSKLIILLQNGIGNEDLISKEVEKNKLIRIVTSHGAVLKNPGKVIHTGRGFTKIGFPFQGDIKTHNMIEDDRTTALIRLKELLDESDIQTEIVNDIMRHCWAKAFVNIGINVIGAVTRLKNGDLLKNDILKHYMTELVKEAILIAKTQGFVFQDEKYVELMFTVARETADNENSMLQDIKMEKQTEIDFLNGKIVSLAEEVGINVPYNSILTALVKGLEQSYIKKG